MCCPGKLPITATRKTGQKSYNIEVITFPKPVISFFSVLLLALLALAAAPAQQDNVQNVSTVQILVVRENGGKPVKNAEVVLHLLDKNGNQKQDGLELKTHEDGKAGTGGVPYGKVRIQVIAHGFRTWGDDFEVNQPTVDITIKLQKPKDQFSIYK